MTRKKKKKTTTRIQTIKPKKVVYKPINEKILKQVCNMDITEFESYKFDNLPLPTVRGEMGENVDSRGMRINLKQAFKNPSYHLFYDRGADILAVAHLDTYGDIYKHFSRIENRIYNASLDDRLGAYLILSYLSHLPYDILLTIGEESGNSTAQYFETDKQYNWIFEFDRGGIDTVLYQYEDLETIDLIESFGWRAGIGSFSDISCLSHLNCKAFNFGAGYYEAHDPYSYMVINDTQKSAQQFESMFEQYKNVSLPHDESMEYYAYYNPKFWHDSNKWKGYDNYTNGTFKQAKKGFKMPQDTMPDYPCNDCIMDSCHDCPEMESIFDTCHGCSKVVPINDLFQDYCAQCWEDYMGIGIDDIRDYKKDNKQIVNLPQIAESIDLTPLFT